MKHKQEQNRGCFVCGCQNPIGLNLDFFYDDEEKCSFTELTIPENYIGYDDIFHGGIIAALFDDTMYYAAKQETPYLMTANLNVTYKAPSHVGRKVYAKGRVTDRRERVITAKAVLMEGDKLLAEAEGTFVVVPAEKIGI